MVMPVVASSESVDLVPVVDTVIYLPNENTEATTDNAPKVNLLAPETTPEEAVKPMLADKYIPVVTEFTPAEQQAIQEKVDAVATEWKFPEQPRFFVVETPEGEKSYDVSWSVHYRNSDTIHLNHDLLIYRHWDEYDKRDNEV